MCWKTYLGNIYACQFNNKRGYADKLAVNINQIMFDNIFA